MSRKRRNGKGSYSFCRYCERTLPTEKMVVKSETLIKNGKKRSYAWVGCKECWDNLQKVS